MIKISTFCSGIGAAEQAFKNLDIPHEVVFACEIDKYARMSYEANHSAETMYEDMTQHDYVDAKYYSDINISGIPCQAFSLAGLRKGENDSRGLLFYDFYRYVKNQQPKVFIIENVKGLLSDNKGKTFQNWLLLLGRSVNSHEQMFIHEDSLEYNLHYTVLNSKNFGVPQNRERVFIVGIRKDLPNDFRFPIGWRLDKRLRDVLETEVDEKYYLSEKMSLFLKNREGSFKPSFDITKESKCIVSGYYKTPGDGQYVQVNSETSKGYETAKIGAIRGRNPENPTSRQSGLPTQQMLEVNENGTSNCLTTVQKDNVVIEEYDIINPLKDKTPYGWHFEQQGCDENGITRTVKAGGGSGNNPKLLKDYRIRKLTPRECFRLMDFPDTFDFSVVSDSQAYKQAGNSIVVNVMKEIINNLIHILG